MSWYEKHGYPNNPFDCKSPETIRKISGLGKHAGDVIYNIEAGNMALIDGTESAGRGLVISATIENFRGEKKLIYFDCSKESVDVKKLMQNKYGIIGRIFNLTPKGMILLLDNFRELDAREMQRAKYYFDNNYIHAVVFAGDGAVLPPNISDRVGNRVIRLKEMTPKECTDIVRDVLGNLKFLQPNLIEQIRRKSSGVESFLENCSRTCAAATEDDSEAVEEKHLLAVKDG